MFVSSQSVLHTTRRHRPSLVKSAILWR